MKVRYSRREILMAAGAVAPSFLQAGVPGTGTLRKADSGVSPVLPARRQVLIHLEGGWDGLNAVVPFFDPDYYRLRPSHAIGPPARRGGGAVDLDGRFGFHPSLAPLAPLFRDGRVLVFPAAGQMRQRTSHFQANRALFGSLAQTADGDSFAAGAEIVTLTGWDDHLVPPGGSDERLERLAGLILSRLERAKEDTVLMTVTEFGRSVRVNQFGGTDHGWATVVLVAGNSIDGGRVVGEWPGLEEAASAGGNHLKPTAGVADIYARLAGAAPDLYRSCGDGIPNGIEVRDLQLSGS